MKEVGQAKCLTGALTRFMAVVSTTPISRRRAASIFAGRIDVRRSRIAFCAAAL
jgi:hypothetical protein